MNELTTVPYSVRKQLDELRSIQAQGRTSEAASFARQIAVELARTSPELCVLVLTSIHGFTELSVCESETTMTEKVVPRKLFGREISYKVEQLATNTKREKTWRLR